MLIERLGGEYKRLLKQELIKRGQYRRIEPDRVLDKQDELHSHFVYIVVGIHLVLKQLDYGKQQVDISQPAEHIVDSRQILFGKSPRHLLGEWRENDYRDIGIA